MCMLSVQSVCVVGAERVRAVCAESMRAVGAERVLVVCAERVRAVGAELRISVRVYPTRAEHEVVGMSDARIARCRV